MALLLSPSSKHDLDLPALTASDPRFALAVSFPKSRSGAHPAAVNICRGASRYDEATIEGVTMHFAAFAREHADMARALAVVSTLRGYKGLLIYSGGKLREWARTVKVLQCYSDSAACNDFRAHCFISVHRASVTRGVSGPAPVVRKPNANLFPCRILAMSFQFKIQAGHPSSEADQIQAGAIREGCAWCPNFRSESE